MGYQHTVGTTWSVALQTLEQSGPAATALLTLAAYLAPDDLPQALIAAHPEVLPEPLAGVARDPLALGDTVAALRRYSLVRVIGDSLYVHRLVQTVVRTALEADAEVERTWAVAALLLLRTGFPDPSNDVGNWPECERLLPHALVAADHAQRLDVEPEAYEWVLNQVAVYLWSRGQYRQAEPLLERVVTSSSQRLGDDNPTGWRS